MPNYRAMARRAARRHGLDPKIFERQIQQESGFAEDVITGRRASPAGAQGIAQIMPDTARGWGVDPLNPRAALNAAAKNMASYVKKYGGYENALRAYNAGPGAIQKSKGYSETNNYVRTILGGRDPGRLSRPSAGGTRGGGGTGPITLGDPGQAANVAAALADVKQAAEQPQRTITGPTASALLQTPSIMPEGYKPVQSAPPSEPSSDLKGALEKLGDLEDSIPAVKGGEPKQTSGSYALGGSGKTRLAPGGGYAGTTRPVIELAKLAHSMGLQTTSAKRGTVNTASGGVSDHYAGNKTANARDLSGSVANMDRAAVKIAKQLGIKGYKRGRPLVASVNRNGIRYQLLYRTNTGGDHFDHIHVGAKRI